MRLSGVSLGALREVDLVVAPGELLGVASTEPACCEALLRVLGRTEDPEAGQVELDGVPLSALDPAQVRLAVLVASHDADLFEGTLGDNVGPGEHAERAMAAAAADEVARALPLGAATGIGDGGRALSGGSVNAWRWPAR